MRVGMVRTAASLLSSEGPRAFYTGLGPALARGVFYGGTRLGLYSPLRDAISAALDGGGEGNRGGEASTSYGRSQASPSPPSFGAGLAAGCLSGCAAAALTKCVLVVFCFLKVFRAVLSPPPPPRHSLHRYLWSPRRANLLRLKEKKLSEKKPDDSPKKKKKQPRRPRQDPAAGAPLLPRRPAPFRPQHGAGRRIRLPARCLGPLGGRGTLGRPRGRADRLAVRGLRRRQKGLEEADGRGRRSGDAPRRLGRDGPGDDDVHGPDRRGKDQDDGLFLRRVGGAAAGEPSRRRRRRRRRRRSWRRRRSGHGGCGGDNDDGDGSSLPFPLVRRPGPRPRRGPRGAAQGVVGPVREARAADGDHLPGPREAAGPL